MTFLRLIPFALSLFSFFPRSASQIADDFSDGDFSQNPAWQGDMANFKINTAGELQLNASGAGQSTLWVAGSMPDSNIWEMDLRMGFDPSANNLLRVVLQSDQAELANANAYYLEIGETGSADAIRFFRQDGASKTQLAAGQPGLAASSPDLHLRIKRTSSGIWTLEAAPAGASLQAQFMLTETTWPGGANRFFGFSCVYTSSNSTKFYFDNINIRPDVPDTQPPLLISASAGDETTVLAVFNETLDSLSAVNPANYTISNGVGQPLSAALQGDKKTVRLTTGTPLANGSYSLQTSGVKDIAGNASSVQVADFQFIKINAAAEFDILINEIMADPDPSVGLPKMEWIELYNRSAKTIDLSTLRIKDETGAPVSLPVFIVEPGTYVVLTALLNAAALDSLTTSPVIGAAIGTTTLNNDADVLTLSNSSGQVIDIVSYSMDWHTDLDKDDGGWSLERINPGLPCLGRENWQSCPTLPGGTPGAQNASFQNAPDEKAPRLLSVFPESPGALIVRFSEGLEKIGAEIPAEYNIFPAVNIISATVLPEDRSKVRLVLAAQLQQATVYALRVGAGITDCSDNAVVVTDTVFFGLPEKPDPHDIVVNELMFNPATGNGRYVEFYNRSQKIFNWSEFFIANFSGGTSVAPVEQERLFLPGQYDVFTEFPNNVRSAFTHIRPLQVLENDLPSLADDAGNITLYWVKNGVKVVVDSFDYSEDFHNALFTDSDRDGVALERIDAEGFTNAAANWTSAAPVITGAPGTPTLPNSQRLAVSPGGNDLIHLPVERLSPDFDGYEDYLDIFYTLPETGYFAAVTIFDSDGIPIKRLVRQELIGTEGALRWDGDLDDGTRAKPGIYVLFLELYAPGGATERVKKAVAVVGRF